MLLKKTGSGPSDSSIVAGSDGRAPDILNDILYNLTNK